MEEGKVEESYEKEIAFQAKHRHRTKERIYGEDEHRYDTNNCQRGGVYRGKGGGNASHAVTSPKGVQRV